MITYRFVRYFEATRWLPLGIACLIATFIFAEYGGARSADLAGAVIRALLTVLVFFVVFMGSRGLILYARKNQRIRVANSSGAEVIATGHLGASSYSLLASGIPDRWLSRLAAGTLYLAVTNDALETWLSISSHPPQRLQVMPWDQVANLEFELRPAFRKSKLSVRLGAADCFIFIVESESLLGGKREIYERLRSAIGERWPLH